MNKWRAMAAAAVLGTGLISGLPGSDAARENSGDVSVTASGEPQQLGEIHVDTTGDGTADTVKLIGKRTPVDRSFFTELTLVVSDGFSGEVISYPLNEQGRDPLLYPVDGMPHRGTLLLVSVDTGGSGGIRTSALVSFQDDKPEDFVPRDNLNAGLNAKVRFQDGFRAVITEPGTGKSVTVDIGDRRADYIRMGVYDSAGHLRKPIDGMVDGYSVFVPILQPNGWQVFEGRQRISGVAHADGLALLDSTWTIGANKLELLDVRIQPLTAGAPTTSDTDYTLDNQPAPAYPPGTKFTVPGEEPGNHFVLDSRYADINGDGVRDSVLLIGRAGPPETALWQNMRAAVVDGSSGKVALGSVGDHTVGYGPHLWVGSVEHPGQKEMLVQIHPEGNGEWSYYSLLAFKNGAIVPVVDQTTLTAGISKDSSVQFLPGFLAEVRMPSAHLQWVFDVSDWKVPYMVGELYDEQGKLLKPRTGWVDPLASLTPVDQNGDGVYETLIGVEPIFGEFNTDQLGTAEVYWKLVDDKLTLQSVKIVPYRYSVPAGA